MNRFMYPCLWFDQNALVAAQYYCSVFKDSEILSESPMVVMFRLRDMKFMALNGGPRFTFNESVSFTIECEDQNEIDYFWDHLSKGGEESMCGWVKDQFGVWWQVVPTILESLMKDPAKSPKVMQALMQMKKFDIAKLQEAYDRA